MILTKLTKKFPLLVLVAFLIIIIILLLSHFVSYTPPKLKRLPYAVDEKILLLFWSNLWGVAAKKSEGFLEKGFEKHQCPVACEVTSNRNRIKRAHAFIIHARDPFPLPPTKEIPWVLTSLENPVYTPVLQSSAYMSQFQMLRSYRLDSDFPTPLFKKPRLDPPVPFANKTGGVMATFTNCEPVRTEYLRQLTQYISVDSYGACLRNRLGLIGRYGPDFKKMKSKLQRTYKFALTFFNQDCDYFVDDQISHALDAGSVPVVMGTDKIHDFLPGNLKNAIINVRDFKNPRELAERLNFLMNNELEYNKYLEWKRKGLGEIGDTVIGKYWTGKFHPWCGVCQAVAQGKWHKQGLKVDICQPRRYRTWGIYPL